MPADTEHFQIDFDALEERINAHTRGVIINSPNNPSGTVYSEGDHQKLSDLLEEKSKEIGRPIFIIADEPYRGDSLRRNQGTVCDQILRQHTGMLLIQQVHFHCRERE